MGRRRLTQVFPFLLPLRKWQRKRIFYLKMNFDSNKYAKKISSRTMENIVFETSSKMVNENSGYDIKYQINKVHNLKLAAKTLDGLVVEPGETFSFWQLVKDADKNEPYREGLNLAEGQAVGAYGGGLCQLSNMLFWAFLHSPFELVERHGHAVQLFPPSSESLPLGIDATISEGWQDLKIKNTTDSPFQIAVTFDESDICCRILSDCEVAQNFEILNKNVEYFRRNERIYERVTVDCVRTDVKTNFREEYNLYSNVCEVGYALPDDTMVKEGDSAKRRERDL